MPRENGDTVPSRIGLELADWVGVGCGQAESLAEAVREHQGHLPKVDENLCEPAASCRAALSDSGTRCGGR